MGSPVPLGVSGELYVGGVGVGRGYLNDPCRTAVVFLPDPFSGQPGARLYKTGDLVRYGMDGNLEFNGRLDDQVKIRGFRIELAEIEVALREHKNVREAVVVSRQRDGGEKQIIAYIIPKQTPPPEPDNLRDFLQRRLPTYMTPSAFAVLDELPLTPNGKVDRTALPGLDESQLVAKRNRVAPESALETKLIEIWSEILNADWISIHDNFFSVGGHSLTAIRVINRVNEAFGIRLPVGSLFEEPTIGGLALLIEEHFMEMVERDSA
jgi:acyl carrier protein